MKNILGAILWRARFDSPSYMDCGLLTMYLPRQTWTLTLCERILIEPGDSSSKLLPGCQRAILSRIFIYDNIELVNVIERQA